MKRKKLYIGIVASLSIIYINSAFVVKSSGAHISSTGAPGEETCNIAYCHDDASVESGEAVNSFIFSGINDTYVPGETYNITIRSEYDNIERFGFQVTALNGSNERVGTFVITNSSRTQIQNGNGRQYVTHKVGGTMATSSGVNEWDFEWTAPNMDEGPITFYYATQATNNDNTNSGEMIFLSSAQITSGVGIDPVLEKIDLNVHYKLASNQIIVRFNAENRKDVPFKIYDIEGKLVVNTKLKSINTGANTSVITLHNFLTSGIYFIETEVNGINLSKKLYIK